MVTTDPRIDAFIEKQQPFAKPILAHIRKLIHKGCPACVETIKWGMPSFSYNGKILAGMAAFKNHAILGFWNQEQMSDPHGLFKVTNNAMGSLGKLTTKEDLPPDEVILSYIAEAMKLIDSGVKRQPKHEPRKKDFEVPDYLVEALSANSGAMSHFENFSPSKKREYVEWLTEAKTDATRQKRLSEAVEWISEGKSRNWKYERK